VREALIALEVEGYVEVRVGSGVYVTQRRPAARSFDPLPGDSGPFELISARRLLESECAALAARQASPAQIRRMQAALTAMERDRRRAVMPLDNDRRFHLEIAEASGNSALALAVRTLWDQRTGPLFLRLERHFDTPDLWEAAIAEHNVVMAAIEGHDPGGARAAMRRHMDAAARRFQRSWSAGARS
jgi:DNA-binding FadR family transcriptional regulator